jgi:hypothetical protein
MKQILITIILSSVLLSGLYGQITYTGCNGTIAAGYPITLNLAGSVGARNIYVNTLPGTACSAGTCAFRVIWAGIQWEIQLSTDGGASYPNVLYINTVAATPNPPDLTLGSWVAQGPCTGQPLTTWSGDVQSTTTLPVELISFSGEIDSKTINLFWQTASELNNEKFEIESSINGREFNKIGQIEGSGTTLEQKKYKFNIENPIYGLSYYRLKQIDYDGQFEYSKVISLNFKGKNEEVGEFYPNPSKSGLVNLDYTSQNDDKISVSVFDMTGKLVVNQTQRISNGNNNLSFDFSDLNTGIYTVKIGDERNPVHRKLIIEK